MEKAKQSAMDLAKAINNRGLLGAPIKLNGGRKYGSAATGWYYSISDGIVDIDDAVLACGCGYRQRGEARDNVYGPFPSRTLALKNLADWIDSPEGREWAEEAIAESDAQANRLSAVPSSDPQKREARRRKRARYAANRRARGLPVHHG